MWQLDYVKEGTFFKAFYYIAPYLSVVFRAHFFWDTWYSDFSGVSNWLISSWNTFQNPSLEVYGFGEEQ